MVHEDNEVFIHVSGEITEVGIIEEDALVQYATFPIGIHDFLRAFNTNIPTYDDDMLYQKEISIKSKDSEALFEQTKQNWVQSLVQILTHSREHAPSKILLFGHTKTLDFFNELLGQISKDRTNLVLNNYRIIHFDISLLKDIITYKTPLGEKELDLQLEALI